MMCELLLPSLHAHRDFTSEQFNCVFCFVLFLGESFLNLCALGNTLRFVFALRRETNTLCFV